MKLQKVKLQGQKTIDHRQEARSEAVRNKVKIDKLSKKMERKLARSVPKRSGVGSHKVTNSGVDAGKKKKKPITLAKKMIASANNRNEVMPVVIPEKLENQVSQESGN